MLLIEEEKKALISELRAKGISDEKLLSAFYKVPREKFIPEPFRKYAYEDNALPIECKQTISQPFTIAYMTIELEVKEGDKVLEIGTGSGYQAAILCELGAVVYSIERIEHLYQTAGMLLESLKYKLHLKCSDGTLGWEEEAPFDCIIVTAGAPSIPKTLVHQLKIDGRMVVPVGSLDTQKLYVLKRSSEGINYKVHESFKFVPLLGEEGWENSV